MTSDDDDDDDDDPFVYIEVESSLLLTEEFGYTSEDIDIAMSHELLTYIAGFVRCFQMIFLADSDDDAFDFSFWSPTISDMSWTSQEKDGMIIVHFVVKVTYINDFENQPILLSTENFSEMTQSAVNSFGMFLCNSG